jgi:glucose-6-phosphate isomerase
LPFDNHFYEGSHVFEEAENEQFYIGGLGPSGGKLFYVNPRSLRFTEIVGFDTISKGAKGIQAFTHQGTLLIPTDFILCTTSLYGKEKHQDILVANCLAQTEALLMGTHGEDVSNPFKVFQGNKPSNLLTLNKLSPESLGALIAMYEHKIFVQGAVLNIYSYDQFGVELGKKMANKHLAG